MESIIILLINTNESLKVLLEKQLSQTNSLKFIIEWIDLKGAEKIINTDTLPYDVILFDDKTSQSSLIHLTTLYRANRITVPILLLTNISEVKLSSKLQKAGVDDLLNIEEINTPVFLWSFMSIIKQVELRKKADEFDEIRNCLKTATQMMSSIIHDINNPLSVIQLAISDLGKKNLPESKRELLLSVLSENIDILKYQIKKLKNVNQDLKNETLVLTKVLTAKLDQLKSDNTTTYPHITN